MEKIIYEQLDFLLDVGQAYLECGSETYRCDEAINYMFKKIGVGNINVFVVPTQITIDIVCDGKHYCGTKPVSKRSLNLNKVSMLNSLSRSVSSGETDMVEAVEALKNIRNHKNSKTRLLIGSALSAAFFALLLGGGLCEFITSLIGGILVTLISFIFGNDKYSLFLTNLAGGMLASPF